MKACEAAFRSDQSEEMQELWDGPPNAKGFYKVGFRAALEWVLGFSECDSGNAIRRTIRQELETE